jgi:hypothetical protein
LPDIPSLDQAPNGSPIEAPLLPSKQTLIAIFVSETGRQDGSNTKFQSNQSAKVIQNGARPA